MNSTTYYVKRGRRYVPVAQYDDGLMSALPEGSHLVTVTPGCRSTVQCIYPANAAVAAVLERHRSDLCRILLKASEMKPRHTALTPEQAEAWGRLKGAFGEDMATLHVDSANDIISMFYSAIRKDMCK